MLAVTFVSKASLKNRKLEKLERRLVAVKNTRRLGKKHMVHNSYLPKMQRRSRDLRGARGRRIARLRARAGAADGAALLSLLMERLELPFRAAPEEAGCARAWPPARRCA